MFGNSNASKLILAFVVVFSTAFGGGFLTSTASAASTSIVDSDTELSRESGGEIIVGSVGTVVEDTQPSVESVSASSKEVLAGWNVSLSAEVTAPDGIQSIDWDMDGDNVTDATGENITYQFNQSGTHNISVTVADSDGDTDTEYMTLYVDDGNTTVTIKDSSGSDSVVIPGDVHEDINDQQQLIAFALLVLSLLVVAEIALDGFIVLR